MAKYNVYLTAMASWALVIEAPTAEAAEDIAWASTDIPYDQIDVGSIMAVDVEEA